MNDNAKLWVKALRSGEYRQASCALRTSHGYCCLGVACDVYMKATGEGEWSKPSIHDLIFSFQAATSLLPDPVANWLGLTGIGADYATGDEGVDASLASDNDLGRSFETIADTIEAEPEGLFAPSA